MYLALSLKIVIGRVLPNIKDKAEQVGVGLEGRGGNKLSILISELDEVDASLLGLSP